MNQPLILAMDFRLLLLSQAKVDVAQTHRPWSFFAQRHRMVYAIFLALLAPLVGNRVMQLTQPCPPLWNLACLGVDWFLISVLGVVVPSVLADEPSEQLFVRRIVPLFHEKCLASHGNDEAKIKGGWTLG